MNFSRNCKIIIIIFVVIAVLAILSDFRYCKRDRRVKSRFECEQLGSAAADASASTEVMAEKGKKMNRVSEETPVGTPSSRIIAEYQKNYRHLPPTTKAGLVRKTNGIFQLIIDDQNYFIDMKNDEGGIHIGVAEKPDVTIMIAEQDFVDLVSGKLKCRAAYQSGQLKFKGSMFTGLKLKDVLKALKI